jgi:hypothetical protein
LRSRGLRWRRGWRLLVLTGQQWQFGLIRRSPIDDPAKLLGFVIPSRGLILMPLLPCPLCERGIQPCPLLSEIGFVLLFRERTRSSDHPVGDCLLGFLPTAKCLVKACYVVQHCLTLL